MRFVFLFLVSALCAQQLVDGQLPPFKSWGFGAGGAAPGQGAFGITTASGGIVAGATGATGGRHNSANIMTAPGGTGVSLASDDDGAALAADSTSKETPSAISKPAATPESKASPTAPTSALSTPSASSSLFGGFDLSSFMSRPTTALSKYPASREGASVTSAVNAPPVLPSPPASIQTSPEASSEIPIATDGSADPPKRVRHRRIKRVRHVPLSPAPVQAGHVSDKVCWEATRQCCYEEEPSGYKCKDYYQFKYSRCHPTVSYEKKCGESVDSPKEHPQPASKTKYGESIIKNYDANYGPHVEGYPPSGESPFYETKFIPSKPYGVTSEPFSVTKPQTEPLRPPDTTQDPNEIASPASSLAQSQQGRPAHPKPEIGQEPSVQSTYGIQPSPKPSPKIHEPRPSAAEAPYIAKPREISPAHVEDHGSKSSESKPPTTNSSDATHVTTVPSKPVGLRTSPILTPHIADAPQKREIPKVEPAHVQTQTSQGSTLLSGTANPENATHTNHESQVSKSGSQAPKSRSARPHQPSPTPEVPKTSPASTQKNPSTDTPQQGFSVAEPPPKIQKPRSSFAKSADADEGNVPQLTHTPTPAPSASAIVYNAGPSLPTTQPTAIAVSYRSVQMGVLGTQPQEPGRVVR